MSGQPSGGATAALTVWYSGATTQVPYDPGMKASALLLRAAEDLLKGVASPPDPTVLQLVKVGIAENGLSPNKTLAQNKVEAGDGLILTKQYRQTSDDLVWARVVAVYSAAVLVASASLLAALWPSSAADLVPAGPRLIRVRLPFYSFGPYSVGPEALLLYIVVLGGIIGAAVFSLYALSTHVSANRDFDQLWTAWYVIRPFLGGGLAVVVYAAVRAGFFAAGTGVSDVSVVGVATISFLVGLFTDNAMSKIHSVADTLFGNPPSSPSDKTS
jgi:hypothetical protein